MDDVIKDIITDLGNAIPKEKVMHYYYGKPSSLSEPILTGGAIAVIPVSTDVSSVTTGPRDQDDLVIRIVLMKNIKTSFYKDSGTQSAMSFLVDVMDGREADRSLSTDSIRYIIRNNMRDYGQRQTSFNIEYNTADDNYLGAATATLEFTQEGHQVQLVN